MEHRVNGLRSAQFWNGTKSRSTNGRHVIRRAIVEVAAGLLAGVAVPVWSFAEPPAPGAQVQGVCGSEEFHEPGNFRGFVPAVPDFARILWEHDQCRVQGSGSRWGHWDGYDLIAEISQDRQPKDAWALSTEDKLTTLLNAHPQAVSVHVKQVRCGENGCLIDFTLEKRVLTFQQAENIYNTLLTDLTHEPSLARDFVTPSEQPRYTGAVSFWGPESNPLYEKVWVWQRRR